MPGLEMMAVRRFVGVCTFLNPMYCEKGGGGVSLPTFDLSDKEANFIDFHNFLSFLMFFLNFFLFYICLN